MLWAAYPLDWIHSDCCWIPDGNPTPSERGASHSTGAVLSPRGLIRRCAATGWRLRGSNRTPVPNSDTRLSGSYLITTTTTTTTHVRIRWVLMSVTWMAKWASWWATVPSVRLKSPNGCSTWRSVQTSRVLVSQIQRTAYLKLFYH